MNWTDGTDMNFADYIGGQWPELIDAALNSYPPVSRHELVKTIPIDTQPYLFKFTRPGDEFAYCKLYCGDFGYYRVVPTNVLDLPAPQSVN